jgi:hypothetical protein
MGFQLHVLNDIQWAIDVNYFEENSPGHFTKDK